MSILERQFRDTIERISDRHRHLNLIRSACENGLRKVYYDGLCNSLNMLCPTLCSVVTKMFSNSPDDFELFKSAEAHIIKYMSQACSGDIDEKNLTDMSVIHFLENASPLFKTTFLALLRIDDNKFFITIESPKQIKTVYAKYWLGRLNVAYAANKAMLHPEYLELQALASFDQRVALIPDGVRDEIEIRLNKRLRTLPRIKFDTNNNICECDTEIWYPISTIPHLVYISNVDYYADDDSSLDIIITVINKIRKILYPV